MNQDADDSRDEERYQKNYAELCRLEAAETEAARRAEFDAEWDAKEEEE